MCTNKWLISAVLLMSIGGTVGLVAIAGDNADETVVQLHERLQKMLDDRVMTAQDFFAASQAAYEAGTLVLGDMLHSADDLRDAELAAATLPVEKTTILDKHLERMNEFERKIEALWKEGAKGGSTQEHAQMQFERKSAQIAVLKARIEQAKSAEPKK